MTLGLRIDGGNPGNQGTLDFLAPFGASFDLAPETAVKFFQDKGLKTSFAWQDMMRQEHAKAFTIAKMMDADMLKDMKALIDQAIAQGESLRWFQERATPYLQSKGWWGKQLVTDPLTGAQVTAQLGSAARLETIFRTNMMSAYAVGQWEQIQAQKAEAPYLLYDAIDDGRTRPEHRALDGVVRKVDDAFWKTHTPPLAWNCRCHLIQLSDDELEQFGIEKKAPPKETKGTWINPRTGKKYTLPISPETGRFVVEPGFDYNPGEHYLKKLAKLAAEKAAQDQAAAEAIKKAAERAAKLKAKTEAEAAAQDAIKMMAKELGAVELERSKNKVALRIAKEKAKTELALIAKGQPTQDPGGFKKKAFKQLSKIPGWENGTPEAQLSAVKAKAEQLKQHHANLTKLSAYKKNVLAGKAPTPAQKAAFDTLSADEQAAFLAKIEAEQKKIQAAKAAARPKPAEDLATKTGDDLVIHWDEMTQIGNQAGSNAGGLFQNVTTGEKFYIKFPNSEDIARNEVLAGKLYRLAGVPNVAETHLITGRDGRIGIASRIVEGLERNSGLLTTKPPASALEGFAADAWLANWDVVGLAHDNLLIKAGQAYRIDAGGALRYRAQGGLKGANLFGPTVLELDSLRNPSINPQAAGVFKHVTEDDIIAGVRKIAAITDDDLERVVRKYGPTDSATQDELIAILKARRDDLVKRYPKAAQPLPTAKLANDAGDIVTELDMVQIRDARSNGYVIPTDSGDIEDHNVLIWHERIDGMDYTKARFKLREEAAAKLTAEATQKAAGLDTAPLDSLDVSMLETVKGLATNPKIRQKDLDRITAALTRYSNARKHVDSLVAAGRIEEAEAIRWAEHYRPWINYLGKLSRLQEGDTFKWDPPAHFAGYTLTPKPIGQTLNRFTRVDTTDLTTKQIQRGAIVDKTGATRLSGVDLRHYQATIGPAKVQYWATTEFTPQAIRGQVEITIEGTDRAAALSVFDTIKELGVKARRATRADREELYLIQIAYVRRDGFQTFLEETKGIADQDQRIAKMKDWLSEKVGFRIDQSPEYRPDGQYEAFGHGYLKTFRPDIPPEEFAAFARDHVLFHQITSGDLVTIMDAVINSGGKMIPTTEKIRKGIIPRGMSPEADMTSGGADYFFTRIKRIDPKQLPNYGQAIYWKSDLLKRLDAISYDHDAYGRTTEDYVIRNRKTGIAEWKAAAGKGGNETIFKNGLSVFDGLQAIVVNSKAEKAQLIEIFKKHKYDRWPDGRSLDDVILAP